MVWGEKLLAKNYWKNYWEKILLDRINSRLDTTKKRLVNLKTEIETMKNETQRKKELKK